MKPPDTQGARLQAGPEREPPSAGPWELRLAYVLCTLLVFGLLMSPFAEMEHAAVEFVFVLFALPMLFSWVGLLGIHLGRILTGQYNLATALVALFVPFLGLAWVSLRLPRSMA